MTFPKLSAYDPAAASEGALDPLRLYQIADQLATKLVPGVRELMQRIRFLTTIAVGVAFCEDIDGDLDQPHSPPLRIWDWLVVEALVRLAQDLKKGFVNAPQCCHYRQHVLHRKLVSCEFIYFSSF